MQDYGDTVLFGSGYTVTEDVIPAGWEFVSVDCSASSGVTPSIVDETVTFAIDDEDDVLDCTYTNRALGDITVVKITDDGFGTFDFTSGTLPQLAFKLTTTAPGLAGQDSRSRSTTCASGPYDVAETVPPGWRLVSAICAGDDDGTDPASRSSWTPARSVVCTFHDARRRGAIEINKTRKHAADGQGDHPHPGVTFTVTGGELPAAGIDVVTGAGGQACLDGLVVSSLVGNYTVTETVPDGYVADGLTAKPVSVTQAGSCTDPPDDDEATVSFSNTPLTNLTVSVDSQVDGGTASTIDCGDGPVGTDPDGDGSLTLEDLQPQTVICTIVIDP